MRKITLRGAIALTMASLALTAATLSAAPAATAAPSQPSWCGWQPANNSAINDFIFPQSIYDGQSTQCNSIAYSGISDNVEIRCTAGGWYYIFDYANSVWGWIPSSGTWSSHSSVKAC